MIICSTLSTQSDALDVGVVLTDKPNAPIRFEKVVDCILCGYVGTEVLFEMSFHYGQVNIPYPGLIFIINMYNSCFNVLRRDMSIYACGVSSFEVVK